MRRPNFFLVGAARSGTTAVYDFLGQHPEIFMSPFKEPCFLALGNRPSFGYAGPDTSYFDGKIKDLQDYENLFLGAKDEKVVGEASTHYFNIPEAAENIFRYAPHAKLLVILRDPADRACSDHLLSVRKGYEPEADLVKAINDEPRRIAGNWSPIYHYLRRGFYYEHITRFLKYFDRTQVSVHFYEDLVSDPLSFMRNIFQYLEVDPGFVPDTNKRLNQNVDGARARMEAWSGQKGGVKAFLNRLLPGVVRRGERGSVRGVNKDTEDTARKKSREMLIRAYRDDILSLQEAFGRDLSAWLRP